MFNHISARIQSKKNQIKSQTEFSDSTSSSSIIGFRPKDGKLNPNNLNIS